MFYTTPVKWNPLEISADLEITVSGTCWKFGAVFLSMVDVLSSTELLRAQTKDEISASEFSQVKIT